MTNAAVVDSMFQELGPGFTTCLRYENITDPVQASDVAQFVAPTNESAQLLSTAMLATVKHVHHSPSRYYVSGSRHGERPVRGEMLRSKYGPLRPTEHASSEAEGMVVERLQQKLDKIERDQCGGSRMR